MNNNNNNKKILSQGLNTILFLIWSTTNVLVQLSLVSTKKSQKKRKKEKKLWERSQKQKITDTVH